MSSLPFFSTNPVRIKAAKFCVMTFQVTLTKSKPVFFHCLKRDEGLDWAKQCYYDWSFFFVWPLPTHVCQKFWRWKHVGFILSDILIRTCFICHIFPLSWRSSWTNFPKTILKIELLRDILKPAEIWWKILIVLDCFAVRVPLVGIFQKWTKWTIFL